MVAGGGRRPSPQSFKEARFELRLGGLNSSSRQRGHAPRTFTTGVKVSGELPVDCRWAEGTGSGRPFASRRAWSPRGSRLPQGQLMGPVGSWSDHEPAGMLKLRCPIAGGERWLEPRRWRKVGRGEEPGGSGGESEGPTVMKMHEAEGLPRAPVGGLREEEGAPVMAGDQALLGPVSARFTPVAFSKLSPPAVDSSGHELNSKNEEGGEGIRLRKGWNPAMA